MHLLRSIAFAAALAAGVAHAQDDNDAAVKAFVSGLTFQSGTVTVPQAHATLKLAPEYRYLGAKDAQNVLENLWGNPPDASVLGMLLPNGERSLLDAKSWAVVVTHVNEGHVSDKEAAGVDYDAMLKEMQQATRDANPEREKQGYGSVELVGWAARPHYDQASNKIYWAKELKFSASAEPMLNYDIRVLGRSGYLSLNAVSSIGELAAVETGMQQVLGMTEFDTGHRYADFNPSTDRVAAYGIAALVGGALATKAGFFAKLLALLLAGKKLVGVAVVGLVALVGRLFKRKG